LKYNLLTAPATNCKCDKIAANECARIAVKKIKKYQKALDGLNVVECCNADVNTFLFVLHIVAANIWILNKTDPTVVFQRYPSH
jgi:hypothetical protein